MPLFEKLMAESGIILLKYWLEVNPEEQTRRLEGRIDDGRKIWKLSPMDLKSYSRWDDYTKARDEMFAATDTAWAPWYVVRSDDKKRARLNLISHLLRQDTLQGGAARKGETAEAEGRPEVQVTGLPVQVHPRSVLRVLEGGEKARCMPPRYFRSKRGTYRDINQQRSEMACISVNGFQSCVCQPFERPSTQVLAEWLASG